LYQFNLYFCSCNLNQIVMKKISLIIALFAGMTLFTSCDDDFLQNLLDKMTGNASTVIGDNPAVDYSSSIVMFNDEAPTPYAVGLAMNMDIDALLNISGVEDLQFPFLVYRVVGDSIVSGTTYTVNNTLTEEDLVDFDYHSLIEGDYADNQLVGIAVSPTQYYILSTGTINVSLVNNSKMEGTFSGSAYFMDIEAEPKLSPDQVNISGSFSSRKSDMLKWVLDMYAEKDKAIVLN